MTSPFEIQIDRETLGRALSQKRLRVDTHQREYSWEQDHIRDLYQDFADVITTGSPGAEHFLGTIVVTRDLKKRPKIVDGQQRLATCLIFLAAIRDYLYLHGDRERANALEGIYLITVDPDTLDPEPHLRLNGTDNEFFRKRILALPDHPDRKVQPDKPSHKRIEVAAQIAAEWVAREASQAREGHEYARLKIWKDFIEDRARVIWVEVPDDSMAFRIFETMNDRGLGLSASDLLKNYLFALAQEERKSEIQQKWFILQGAVESVDEDKHALVTYVRQYWLAAHGHSTRDDLYTKIKKTINSEPKALTFLENLATYSGYYAAILNPDSEFWNKFPETIKYQVEVLHYIRVTQGRPVLLTAIDRFKANAKELEKIFRTIINWSVRLLISGRLGSGSLEEKYGELAREVQKGELRTTKDIVSFFANWIPTDAQFEAAFATADVSKSYLAKYYLRTLEEYVVGKGKPHNGKHPHWDVSRRGGINIEHILPKSLKSSNKVLGEWVFRLGNIVLLQADKNSQLGSGDYKKIKSSELLNSEYALTREAGGKQGWGPDEITERQKHLARLAVEAWPITLKG